MSDTLTAILETTRAHVAAAKAARPLAEIEAAARAAAPTRGFEAALRRARAENRFGLIAEIKRKSPSKGLIRHDFDPAAHARDYEVGGATCLSVLTDGRWFGGALEDLGAARTACALPVLRKDFMVDPYQVAEARAAGADCILLIMAALSDADAAELEAAARDHGLDVLVEVHDAAELARALRLRTRLLGINNRNLNTLQVELTTTRELAAQATPAHLLVCESGIGLPADLLAVKADANVTTFLVGESLMLQPDLEAATRALLGA